MNRRLFWKIFLPFWVAQALLLGTLYMRLHVRLHSENPWWVQPERRLVPALANHAADVYENSGEAALRAVLDAAAMPHRAAYWFIDAQGRELTGRQPSPEVLAAAAKAAQNQGMARPEEDVVLVAPATTSKATYTLIAEYIPPPLSERVPGDILWTLKLGTAVSALMCLIIAHYLSKPIERLRDATNELARGNLDIRVGSSIGRRRDEIADLVHDFDSMADELRNQIQSERNLLSGVSHELRSPIARIRLALALARQSEGSERTEMLDRIEQDTIQLDSMLERILNVARLESGQFKPKFEPVQLGEIVDEVLEDARFEAAGTHTTINYGANGPCPVMGDRGLLHSAIENLVRNAIFYSGEGGVIDVSLRRAENNNALLTVRDNGPGVPESALPLLFKPFFRVDDSRGTKTGGMGLGLAIVRNAVSVHGGGISTRNIAPHGLEIAIRLPLVSTNTTERDIEANLGAPLTLPR